MTGWLKQLNLWQKLLIYILPIVIIPISIVVFIIVNGWTEDLRASLIDVEEEHIINLRDDLNAVLDIPERDLRTIVESDNLQRLSEAIATDNAEQIAAARAALQTDFISISTNAFVSDDDGGIVEGVDVPLYDQIRFLDANGLELVRVDHAFDAESSAFPIAESELQNKATRDYFSRTARLGPSEIYVSPLNLNREGSPSAIEQLEDGSVVPIIRYGMPVYHEGTFTGAVVINVFGRALTSTLHPRLESSELFLINDDGYFLLNTASPELEFGFEDGIDAITGVAGATITDDTFFSDDGAQAILGLRSTEELDFYESESGFLMQYLQVAPDAAEASYAWFLISAADEAVLFSQVNRVTTLGFISVFGLLTFLGVSLFLISQQITSPIRQLSDRAKRMASGELETVVTDSRISDRGDEIGDLNKSFNMMASQLFELFNSMEDRIKARTNDLEASAEIAGAANQVRNQEDLLSLTANLIRDRFNFYYTQVYMIDRDRKFAVLSEGTGYVGRRLLSSGHKLPLDGTSLVAKAINTNEAVVVQDTQSDPNFLPNKLLPDTRSEVAVPLRSQEGIIGVLDIQHSIVNAFAPETVRLFQAMADQLAVTFDNVNLLADTRKRAIELETVAEVSAEATTTLDLTKLLFDVSNLVKRRFELYHAHIYLMNEEHDTLVLSGGAGEAGREMVAEHRIIPLDSPQSLVARAAREHVGVVVNDVTADSDFLPHPLLPDTKAEMAVPMIVGEEVVGVLDVQADITNRFTDEDVRIQTTLAGQVAVAVQNARSFELTQKRASELTTVAEVSSNIASNLELNTLLLDVAELTAEGFDLYHLHLYLMQDDGETLLLVTGTGKAPCQHMGTNFTVNIHHDENPVTQAASMKRGVIDNQVDPEFNLEINPFLPETKSQIAVPLMIGEEVVGVLEAHSDRFNGFSDDDIQIQMTLASQIAVAINNARSFELTEKRALELQTVAEVSAQATSTLDLTSLLFDVSNLVKDRFNLYHAHIYIMNVTNTQLVLTGGAGEAGITMVAENRQISVDTKQSIVARAARERRGIVVNDVTSAANFLPNPLLPETRSEMALPMIVGDEVVGVLDVQANKYDRFTDEDVRIQTTLASQVAVAVQNARSFELTEKRAIELATVAEVSAEATTTLNLDKLLVDVSNLVKERFNLYHTHIYLLNEDLETLVLSGGAGEVGRVMVSEHRTIPLSAEQSIVATAARKRAGQVVNDVTEDPNFLPHPLLPSTKSEMAVPLIVGGNVVGVLDVQGDITDRFTDEDVRIQTTLAAQIAVAVQNARAYERMEAALEQVRQQSTIIETSQDFIALTSMDGVVEYLNPGGLRMMGFESPEEAVGTHISAYHREEDAKRVLETGVSTIMQKDIWQSENYLLSRNGELIPVDQTLFIVRDDEGKPVNIASIMTDISERKQQQALVEKRALELETVATVSAEATTNLDLDTLLTDVSNLVKERFSLYHAHIYLMDDTNTRLVLAGGAGRAGEVMVKEKRSIALSSPQSIVARAARERTGQVVNDVTASENFLPNPLLPRTRSEMAVPMIVGDEVVGVLDVQANIVDRFTEEDVRIKSTLASQVAVAVQNARSFLRTQEALDLASILYTTSQSLINAGGLDDLLMAFVEPIMVDEGSAMLGYIIDDGDNQPQAVEIVSRVILDEDMTLPDVGTIVPLEKPSLLQAIVEDPEVIITVDDIRKSTDIAENGQALLAQQNVQALCIVPLTDKDGNLLGVVNLQWSHPHSISDDQLQLLRVLGPQVTTIIENRRLFEETVKSRERSEALAAINASLSTARDEGEILSAVAVYAQRSGVSAVTLSYIGTDDAGHPNTTETVALWMGGQIIEHASILNQTQNLSDSAMTAHWINQPDVPFFVENVIDDDRVDELFKEQMQHDGIQSLVLLPLYSSGRWQGTVFAAWAEARKFSDEERALYRSLTNSLAAVVASRRSLLDSTRSANELATVASVSTATTTILNVSDLLQSVSDLTKERFDLYHAQIYLLNEEEDALVLAGGSGDAGRHMLDRKHSIMIFEQNSTVVRAFKERQGIIVNDVRDNPMFLPNPLLPETRSEMAIPMIVAGEVIGVLDVQSNRVNRFNDNDIQVKSVLAAQVAVAVQNAQSFAEIERQAERERAVADQLREVDRLKSQFLANMSHELRTPLNSIIGYSEVLLDGVDGELTEDADEDVRAIHDSGKHLLSIINEILDLAKIEAGEMHLDLREVDLFEFSKEITKTGQVLVKDKPVVLEVVQETEMPAVCADPVRLRQVLWNLVSNALKFTEEGSVRVHLNMHDEKHALVTVRDTGIGMSQEGLDVIFQRFSQVDGSSTRRAGGTGLGLTITKQLIEMHGGEIHVDSEENVGSTFWFTMPIYEKETVTEA
jgi:PAS domain S-box-containing protein